MSECQISPPLEAEAGATCHQEDHSPDSLFHPLSQLFPPLDDAALEELADDIRKHGQREPIVQHEGLILDGRNRYLACQKANIEPEYRGFDGTDPLAFVISANLHRRHLNESQRAMVAAGLAKLRDGQRQVGQLAEVPTQSEAATLLNVGPRSVGRAVVVRSDGAPELVAAVERGEVSVSRGAEIARKPVQQQRRELRNLAANKLSRKRRKPSKERPLELDSRSWEDATPEARAQFVSAVGGVEPFWEAASPELRDLFVERRRHEWEQVAPQRDQHQQLDPVEQQAHPSGIPDFLRRAAPQPSAVNAPDVKAA